MSFWLDLFNDPKWIPLAVLMASLAGSFHCAAMCGPLVAASTRSQWEVWIYQLGRLLGYLTLGALAGWVGANLFQTTELAFGVQISALFMAAFFFYFAWRMWNGKTLHFSFFKGNSLVPSLGRLIVEQRDRRPKLAVFSTGLLSAFLPCGWLHTFVLSAVTTRHPLKGLSVLLFFWLGTLPSLTLAPRVLKTLLSPVHRRSPRTAAVFLLFAGLLSLGTRTKFVFAEKTLNERQKQSESCPFH